MRFLDRLQPLGLLVLRLVLGAIMVAHGYHKIFGGMSYFVQTVGHLRLPSWLAYLSAGTEFFGGILVLVGLLTRCAALAMVIDMVIAIWKVHWHNGFLGQGGYEFPLSLAAMAFTLIFFGAGPIALDAIRRGGPGIPKPHKS